MFWFFVCKACGILTPWQRIEPASPSMEGRVLSTELPGKPPVKFFENQ